MCGRFTLIYNSGVGLRFRAHRAEAGETRPRYNIAPTQTVLTITNEEGNREVEEMRWELIPSWAKAGKLPRNTINARDDRIETSGLWRGPFRRSRCLIPADGFYEWTGPRSARRPMYARLREGGLFAFAGLYDTWSSPEGQLLRSCAIVTTVPNELMASIHDRMPVILAEEAEDAWLDLANADSEVLRSLLRPFPAAAMEALPVSTSVNSPGNDSAECVRPLV